MAQTTQILGSYSPEEVTIVLSNQFFSHIISGTADGSFVNVSRVIPHAQLYTGADASHARVVRGVKSADITITLHQASESNDVLSELLKRDEEARDNTWLFTLLIKDNSGRSIYSATQAFIGTVPDSDFNIDISERAWVIHAVNMETHIGGNANFTPDTAATLEGLGYEPDERWNPIQ